MPFLHSKSSDQTTMTRLNSMTGFGRIEIELPTGQLQWEIRSVNHRYLDIQLKLPEGFRVIEQKFRDLISAQVKRGKVDALLLIKRKPGQVATTSLNTDVAKQVIAQTEILNSMMTAPPAPISSIDILRWQGVLEEEKTDTEAAFEEAQTALGDAVDQLCGSRQREGEKLQSMLESRCVDIEALVKSVQGRIPAVLKDIHKKLEQRIKALDVQPDSDRLEQELAMIAQKLDVAEELDRLTAHIAEVRATFVTGEPVGRRLDFLMQELNREANTLGSKSADAETTRQAVDLKVLIEQMREQVQNVE
jgi:uncharacterized protein (TIGR00255 family)